MPSNLHTSAMSPPAAVVGAEDEAPYRTMSVLSIVGLVLGVAAPLAMFAPLLFVIPIAGAAVSLLALRRIALSEGALIGRTAAMIGLALSIASISAAFTRSQLSQELLSLQARARGLEWIGLLQSGDAENAFKMTTASRQGAPAAPGEPPAEPAAAPIDTFRADPVVNFLLTRATAAPVQYDRDTAFDLASGYDARIQQLFTVAEPASSGGASPTAIEIILQRVRGYDGAPSEWDVAAYKSDDVTSHP